MVAEQEKSRVTNGMSGRLGTGSGRAWDVLCSVAPGEPVKTVKDEKKKKKKPSGRNLKVKEMRDGGA